MASAGGCAIRVLLADDQMLMRTGLRMILESEADITVVGEASDGLDAVQQAQRLRPDVVLMDIRMPRLDGLEATRRIVKDLALHASVSEGQTRVVILTTFELDDYVFEAMRAGACGFLLKTAPPDQLIEAVRVAAAGDALLSPSVTRRLIEEFARRSPSDVAPAPELRDLTERELEVLRHVARGLSNAEVADALSVTEATVKTHVAHVLNKLGLRDRVQAVVFAYEHGVVTPGAATA